MKKRSKYRPRAVIRNPMAYLIESMTPVAKHDDFLIDLRLKNHGALAALTQGSAAKAEIDFLIEASNMTEAFCRMGIGSEYQEIARAGSDALFDVAVRGKDTMRFIVKASEMDAINSMMDLHDAQLDIATIKEMEMAMEIMRKDLINKKARVVKERVPQ